MGLWSRMRAAFTPPTVGASAGSLPMSPYNAGGGGRRTRGWYAPGLGPTAVLSGSGDKIRNRCRDLARNNPYARSAIDAVAANTIGTGIVPRPATADPAFNEAVRTLWDRWVGQADPGGFTDLYGLQHLGCRTVVEGGDVLFRLRPRRATDGLAVPLQVQALEPEHLPLWKNETNPQTGNLIRAGVEFDRIGRPVTYWLYREHPGEFTGAGDADALVPVPASEIIHVFRPLRPGQVRGEPWLAIAALRLFDLDEYVDAEVLRKKGAAMFVGSLETPDPDKAESQVGSPSGEAADEGTAEINVEPGSFPVLPIGTTLRFYTPPDVGPNYAAFQQDQLRAIAAGVGLPYEMLTGDLSQVNYSSIRAGTLEFRRRCEAFQWSVWVHQFCRRLYVAWLDAAVLSGALKAPQYATNPERYRAVTWHTQGWKWVDPAKEVAAALDAIRGGLTSRERVIAEQGEDIERIDAENARAMAREASAGLAYSTSVSEATRGAAADEPPAPRGRTGTRG